MIKKPSTPLLPARKSWFVPSRLYLALALTIISAAVTTAAVVVDPAKAVIVLPTNADPLKQDAAQELQKHLNLVTGGAIEIVTGDQVPKGKYAFYVGVPKPGDDKPLASEEARWVITPKAGYLYGTEGRGKGALFAVYSFLESQLGIRWLEPGDVGIAYEEQVPLKLEAGEFQWIPQLVYRGIRQGLRKDRVPQPKGIPETDAFLISREAHNAEVADTIQWRDRMRMGGSRPGGSHAFSDWWKKYGKEHPQYFALNKFGKREPVPLAKAEQTDEFVKICPSNPKVVEQIVADWLPKIKHQRMVDAGVDDGIDNFCECSACQALDVPKEGEKPMSHLTDRYVYLANAVAREVRKHRPDAYVAMYAYLTTLDPPRKRKLEPNVLVQMVPYVDPLDVDVVKKHFEGWRNAGATQIAFRPNYHTKYMTTILPLGIEKQMFDVFQVAVANGTISADYDSLVENWPVTGMSDYILAHAMAEPSKAFTDWEDQYCQGYGPAADQVKAYFRYWRDEVWEKRLKPNITKLGNSGGAGDFARGLQWNLGDYYQLKDFEKAAAILDQATTTPLTPAQQDRLNQLKWANEHARLYLEAVIAKPEDKAKYAEALTTFRKKHKDDLRLLWVSVIGNEINNGDLTGLRVAEEMKGYLKPWLKTELFWKFQIDPQDVGLKEKWQDKPWDALSQWSDLRTDRFWEQQFAFDEPNNLPEELAGKISDYDGIGWYATRHAVPADWKGRQIFLRFGALDESGRIFVNGQLAGKREFKNKNDWKTPFEIRIDPQINWDRKEQVIVVRVEDSGGVGGIWRPVWIVSKNPNNPHE